MPLDQILFTFRVNDGTSNSNEIATVSITINSVNDAPSFTTPGDPAAVNEDVAGQTIASFVTGISPGPSPSESGQAVDFVIDSNSHTALFAVQPAISPTGTLTYTPAPNANGTALITYHLHDDGGTANGGVNISSPNQTFTITVNAVNDAPVAQPKAFSVQTNMKISGLTGLLAGVTDPDATNGAADPLSFDAAAPAYTTPSVTLNNIAVNTCQAAGPPATTSTVTITSAATGTFNFDPSPGMTGTCVLKYQVTDTGKGSGGNQTSAQADITITHTGPVIWFVDPNRATDGNGTLSDTSAAIGPFNKLSSANAKLGSFIANQRVFVYTGSTLIGATEVLLLQSGATPAAAHWLIGQGAIAASFDALFGINPGALPAGTVIARPSINGTRPTIRGTVNMRNNTRVEGVNIDVSGAAAGSKGLTNNNVALGAGSVLTIKDVSVTSTAGNAVDFNNAQTVNYSTSNASTSPNIVVSTTGIAVRVETTTIGADGMTFRSISSNGAPNGIILTNTGSNLFNVTGDGSNTSLGGNSSGGLIQNATGGDGATAGNGVYLSNTSGVTLRRMTINGTNQNHGIRGISSSNFTLEYSTVSGTNGTSIALDEGSVNFDNLTGTAVITSCLIEGGFEENLNVVNTSGTLNRLVITGSTFGFNSTASGNNNILIESQNAGTTLNFTLQSSIIKGARADWINASNNSSSVMDAVIGGSTVALGNTFDNLSAGFVHPGAAAGGNRVVFGAVGVQTVDIRNNTMKGSKGEAIRLRSTATGALTGAVDGRVRNNIIGVAGTANSGSTESMGIFVFVDGGGDADVAITNNSVFQYNNHGIRIDVGDQINAPSIVNATVTGNTVNSPGNLNSDFNGFHLNHGTVAADNFTSCIDVGGAGALVNNLVGSGNGAIAPNNQQFRLRQRQATTVRLPGYAGANNNDAAVVSYLQGRNTVTAGNGAASNTVPTGGGFVNSPGGAACTQPSVTAITLTERPEYFALANELFQNDNTDSNSVFQNGKADVVAMLMSSLRTARSASAPVTLDKSLSSQVVVAAEGVSDNRETEIQKTDARIKETGNQQTANSGQKELVEPQSGKSDSVGSPHVNKGVATSSANVEAFSNFRSGLSSAGIRGLKNDSGRRDVRLNHAPKRRVAKTTDVTTPGNAATQHAANTVVMQPVMPLFPVGTFPVNGTGTGFSLPPGKTTTITFKVTVKNPPNFSSPTTNKVSHQGTLSGAFQNNPLLTDDLSVAPGTTPPVRSERNRCRSVQYHNHARFIANDAGQRSGRNLYGDGRV